MFFSRVFPMRSTIAHFHRQNAFGGALGFSRNSNRTCIINDTKYVYKIYTHCRSRDTIAWKNIFTPRAYITHMNGNSAWIENGDGKRSGFIQKGEKIALDVSLVSYNTI